VVKQNREKVALVSDHAQSIIKDESTQYAILTSRAKQEDYVEMHEPRRSSHKKPPATTTQRNTVVNNFFEIDSNKDTNSVLE